MDQLSLSCDAGLRRDEVGNCGEMNCVASEKIPMKFKLLHTNVVETRVEDGFDQGHSRKFGRLTKRPPLQMRREKQLLRRVSYTISVMQR